MKEIKTYPLKDSYVKLKGQYWIGDPCYIFPDEEWQTLCKLMFPKGYGKEFDDTETIRVVEVDGVKTYLFGTAHGDGCYDLKVGSESVADLGVDAGMLSLIPVKLTRLKGWGESEDMGHVMTFNSTDKMYVNGGDFEYGDITINTSGDDDEDEYFDDEDADEIFFDDDED